jgi:four helix bundle protein
MTEIVFDHDKLDVYRLSIEYVADSFRIAGDLSGPHRHARDQWLRAAQSIPLNIAEGNGKRSFKDRGRYFEIARGSALECAAIQDVLEVSGGIDDAVNRQGKRRLKRIVSMLTKLVQRGQSVAESSPPRDAEVDYEHEHEHEYEATAQPEPGHAPEHAVPSFAKKRSSPRAR